MVIFNGADVPIPEGCGGPLGSSPAKAEAPQVYSAARVYQDERKTRRSRCGPPGAASPGAPRAMITP